MKPQLRTSIENLLVVGGEDMTRSAGLTWEMAAAIVNLVHEVKPEAKIQCVIGRLCHSARIGVSATYLAKIEWNHTEYEAAPVKEKLRERRVLYPKLALALLPGDAILSLRISREILKEVFNRKPDKFREVFLRGGSEQQIHFSDYIEKNRQEKTATNSPLGLTAYCKDYLHKSETDIRNHIRMHYDTSTSRDHATVAVVIALALVASLIGLVFKKWLPALFESDKPETPLPSPVPARKSSNAQPYKIETFPDLKFREVSHLAREEEKKLLATSRRRG